jgi:hypothetical protein
VIRDHGVCLDTIEEWRKISTTNNTIANFFHHVADAGNAQKPSHPGDVTSRIKNSNYFYNSILAEIKTLSVFDKTLQRIEFPFVIM